MGEYLGMHGFGSSLDTYLFLRKIDKINPDVIHLHNLHGYYINIKLLFDYLAKKNIPVVWTLHDCWALTGHCTHFEMEGCYKWQTECNHCTLLMAQYKSRFIDRSRRNYNIKKELYSKLNNLTITTVSKWLSTLISKSILRDHPVEVITNGIDLGIFKPYSNNIREKYCISNNKKIVLGVVASGLGVEKGRSEFIELSKDENLAVMLVGLSSDDRKGLPASIICIDRTNNQKELAEYYSAADVFVNPTYNEALGLTNIEAMACGTPVVTYGAGGSPETIDSSTGIVVKKGDMVELRNAINEILHNGKDIYASACQERVKRLFDRNITNNMYIQLYERLLKQA